MAQTTIDNTLFNKYLTRQVVRSRNSVTLLNWANYTATAQPPASPDDAWIRERIVAENMPLNLDFTTVQTLGYFLQDAATQASILQFISEDNDTTTEGTLAQTNDSVVGAFMPRYAQTIVTDQQVSDWKTRNGIVGAKHE